MQVHIRRKDEYEVYEPLWKFMAGSLTGQPFDFMVGELGYLSGPPLHTHETQYDNFFVLDGVLTLQIGDDILYLSPGDFGSVPPGVAHTFDNTDETQGAVKVINLVTPGGTDATFKELAEINAHPDTAGEEVTAIIAKHGGRMVGPTLGVKLGRV